MKKMLAVSQFWQQFYTEDLKICYQNLISASNKWED